MKTCGNRNYRKWLALMVSGGLAVTALAGCGGSDGGTEQSAQIEVSEGIKTAAEDNKVTTFALPDGSEESEIYVEPIADLPDDFIRGMDASAVLSLENSGVTYYNYEGKEQDVFETLAQSGVNYIRLRVWNDPYDADGNGYGGGNNDVATAVALGKRATAYGMKVCVDFHYSDFWADPKRQHAPKAWEGMSALEKSEALYDFTKESLAELLDAGVDVGMVQVGNEINNGMAGEEDVDTVMDLIASGSRAVREIAKDYGKDIKVAVHYTNIEDYEEVDTMAANLQNAGVDYDLFGLSCPPYWLSQSSLTMRFHPSFLFLLCLPPYGYRTWHFPLHLHNPVSNSYKSPLSPFPPAEIRFGRSALFTLYIGQICPSCHCKFKKSKVR